MMWLAPLLLIALGMIACLGLFLSLKSDLRVRARHTEDRIESMLLRLQQSPIPAPAVAIEAPVAAVSLPPLRSGWNVNRRAQAVRLLRRGEDASHVAAALAVPRSEIELLARVQELVAQRTGIKPAQTG